MSQHPHDPAGNEDSAYEHGETVESVFDLLVCGAALGDAEHDGGKDCKEQCCGEMREFEGHGFFPMAM